MNLLFLEIILGFAFLGMGLKLIDDIYDKEIAPRWIGYIVTPAEVILWLYIMSISVYSSTLLLAILIGVLFAGKVNNFMFILGCLVILISVIFILNVDVLFVPLLVFSFMAFLDEKGNDYYHRKDYYRILKYRPFMKAGVISAVFIFPLLYVAGFFAFELGYDTVEHYTRNRAGSN